MLREPRRCLWHSPLILGILRRAHQRVWLATCHHVIDLLGQHDRLRHLLYAGRYGAG